MTVPPILLLGFGQMGRAMASGWIEQGLSPSYAIDPHATGLPPVICVPDLSGVPHDFAPEAVILAVKPQMSGTTVPPLARFAGQAVFLSIMAGRTLDGIAAMLGPDAAIVRAMPNTPASIRQAVTVACAGCGVNDAQRALCDRLLGAIGVVAWTQEETHLDTVTAISGGGPAYVFLLAELLEAAGIRQGLPPALARMLARSTIRGAGNLLAAPMDARELRQAVTSPNGTTERALAVLMAKWPDAVDRAVAAATARSRELAG